MGARSQALFPIDHDDVEFGVVDLDDVQRPLRRVINKKVRLYARIGKALIAARSSGGDAFAAIEAVLSWPKFESTVAEAQILAQPEEFDYLGLLDERYGAVRKFAPLLLARA